MSTLRARFTPNELHHARDTINRLNAPSPIPVADAFKNIARIMQSIWTNPEMQHLTESVYNSTKHIIAAYPISKNGGIGLDVQTQKARQDWVRSLVSQNDTVMEILLGDLGHHLATPTQQLTTHILNLNVIIKTFFASLIQTRGQAVGAPVQFLIRSDATPHCYWKIVHDTITATGLAQSLHSLGAEVDVLPPLAAAVGDLLGLFRMVEILCKMEADGWTVFDLEAR